MTLSSDMRKCMVVLSLTAEFLMDCRNLMLAALKLSLLHFINLKYNGTFTYITEIVHSNTYFIPLKGIFSEKSLIIQLSILGNLQFPRNMAEEGFELFSCLSEVVTHKHCF